MLWVMKESEFGLIIPHGSAASVHSYIHEGMGSFFDAVDDSDVQEVLGNVFSRDHEYNTSYDDDVIELLTF